LRAEEAQTIGKLLGGLAPDTISPLVNIGSSTKQFRTTAQPHIEKSIFEPLAARGVKVFHADVKADEGVDLVGDVLQPAFRARIRQLQPKAILCSNVLEHVESVSEFVAALEELAPPGGLLLVTAPCSYPYHLDPIDNGFRPDPDALIAAFRRCTPLAARLVHSVTYFDELKELPASEVARRLFKSALRVWLPFYRPDYYKNLLHRWLWLGRRYSVSVALFERGPA
jgi:hypothetical protein